MQLKQIEMRLRTKLSLSFAFMICVIIFVISILTNEIFEKTFIDYVKNQQDKYNEDIVTFIEGEVVGGGGHHSNKEAYGYLSTTALNQGKIITMYDDSGFVIYDARNENSSGCHSMMSKVSENMQVLYPKLNGEFVEKSYDVNVNNNKVGTVSIASYGPFYFDDNEVMLMQNANKVFFGVGTISLLLAGVIGFFTTKKISDSLTNVINTTNLIAIGNNPDEIIKKTTTKEINSLIDSVNTLNKNLSEQKMLRKRLTSDLAHELRTPIATLQGNLEMILEGVWEPTAERVDSCHEEVVRIGSMINELEKLNRIERETEEHKLKKTSFNVSELVLGIITFSEAKAKEKNISISHDLEQIKIHADKEKITQVITNLLSNAIKYTKEDGEIKVKLKSFNDNIIIDVEDTGMGISSEDLPHIFERLYRTEQSRNRSTGGMGIGLSITKAIVDEHGGNIKVFSKLQEGTLFSISLPQN